MFKNGLNDTMRYISCLPKTRVDVHAYSVVFLLKCCVKLINATKWVPYPCEVLKTYIYIEKSMKP